ncbi:MAG: DNA starvation/stationary phase protection protein [Bacteroidetes bacterium]|nr:MAG: DNA starvation/stationary phase protection protein [Bacteroidota bacterium]
MKVSSTSGLCESKSADIAKKLEVLLADMQIFYTNMRGYHWNVKGPAFYDLHKAFEAIYTEYAEHIDSVAERMAQLDYPPTHKFSDYLKLSHLKEEESNVEGRVMVENVLSVYGHLIKHEREIIAMAEEAKDYVTANLMNSLLDGQEKEVWMMTAYMS